MGEIVKFLNVSKSYNSGIGKAKLPVLFDISFSVQDGEVFGFVGPNGAGKSSVIKLMLNLTYPDKGDITVFGKPVNNIENKRYIGYLPEIPYYYDFLTPEELVWFSGKIAGIDDKEIIKYADELFTRLHFNEHRKKKIRELSKGNAQKAGIVATLINRPKLLILDEPMTGLDPIGRKLFGDIIMDLKKNGTTIFLTSHILSDVERFCDSIAIINKGRIILLEKKENLLKSGRTLEDIFCEAIGLYQIGNSKNSG